MTDEFFIGEHTNVLQGPLQTLKNVCMNRNPVFFSPLHILCFFAPPGMDKIYELTNTPTQYELRFDLGLGSERAYAVYDNFKIAPVKQKFKLTIGKYSGTAGGSFDFQVLSNLQPV